MYTPVSKNAKIQCHVAKNTLLQTALGSLYKFVVYNILINFHILNYLLFL